MNSYYYSFCLYSRIDTGYIFVNFITFFINSYIRRYTKKFMKKEQELWEENGRIKARIIIENLLVRIFSKQDYELKKSKKILEEVPSHGIHVDTIHTWFY